MRLPRGHDGADDRGGAAFDGALARHRHADSALAEHVDEVIVCTPELERSGATRRATPAPSRRSTRSRRGVSLASGRGRGRARGRRAALRASARGRARRGPRPARPRRRRRSSCARAPGSPRVPTRPSSSCTATSPPSTSTSGLRARGRRPCGGAGARRGRAAQEARLRRDAPSDRAIRSSTSSISICSHWRSRRPAASTRTRSGALPGAAGPRRPARRIRTPECDQRSTRR